MTFPGYPPVPEPLPRPVPDSHCHLDLDRDGEAILEADSPAIAAAVAAAEIVGVNAIVQVGIDLASSYRAVGIAQRFDHVWATVALHPNEAPRIVADGGFAALTEALAELAQLADTDVVRGIGETGMDFYRTAEAGRAAQEESFRAHIRLAKQLGKTLVVHDRDAHDAVLATLDDEGAPPRVVLHCFSGDVAFAEAAAERGYFCSFAGVVTFKNAQVLRDALSVVPREQLLVETDAPFLTPVPHRGKPNASYLVPLTVRAIATHRQWDLSETCDVLMANTVAAFGPL